MSFVVEDAVEESETAEDYCEGGLNWLGAFKGGIASGVTHVLKCTASEAIMLLAFNILFNMIEHPEVNLSPPLSLSVSLSLCVGSLTDRYKKYLYQTGR